MNTPKTEEETKATPFAELCAQFAHWRATKDNQIDHPVEIRSTEYRSKSTDMEKE